MKSVPLPDRGELQDAYEKLQWAQAPAPPAALVRWAHWSRLDARLAEILVRYVAGNFRQLNPFSLWEENRRSPQPQALAVLLEFANVRAAADKGDGTLRAWSHILTKGLPVASPQMFFVREGTPRPEHDLAQAETSLYPYRRWGFFGTEVIGEGKGLERRLTLLGRDERLRILGKLLRERSALRVEDYINACGGRVHRRTAERDLAQSTKLVKRGATKGRVYRRKARSARPRPKASKAAGRSRLSRRAN